MTEPLTTTGLPTTDAPIRAELYLRGDAHGDLGVKEMVNRTERLEANGVFGESLVAGRWHRFETRTEDWLTQFDGVTVGRAEPRLQPNATAD